jgi:hypothetical protein
MKTETETVMEKVDTKGEGYRSEREKAKQPRLLWCISCDRFEHSEKEGRAGGEG